MRKMILVNDDGFTLLEMLVVLAITAAVYSIAVFSIDTLRRPPSVSSVAEKVVMLCGQVREKALLTSEKQAVTIDLKNVQVTSSLADENVILPEGFRLALTIGKELVTADKHAEIVFLPDGSSSGALLTVSDDTRSSETIEVSWLTGLARLKDGKD